MFAAESRRKRVQRMRSFTHWGRHLDEEVSRWTNNRLENSHLPFRRRERAMVRFRQMKTLQKFGSAHAAFHNHVNQDLHLISRETYKAQRSAALAEWKTLAG
jgi:putative transposase